MNLNCATTIGLAFKYGAGLDDLPIKGTSLLSRLNFVSVTKANLPHGNGHPAHQDPCRSQLHLRCGAVQEMDRLDLRRSVGRRGKMFKDLPNRFPSVLSLDYLENQGSYEDYHNLFAMYLLYYMGRYSIVLNGETRRLEIEEREGARRLCHSELQCGPIGHEGQEAPSASSPLSRLGHQAGLRRR